jgi:Uma2 family endonuclease
MTIAQKSITKKLRLDRSSNGMLMTPEEFDAITDCDDRYVYELIHGVLIVSPPAGETERDPNGELDFLLRLHQYQHPLGSMLDKTLGEQYIFLPNSRRRADRVIWIGLGRIPDPMKDVPSIVIEFVSKRKRDRIRDYEEKRREYLAAGIVEYWVIDRFERKLTIFTNDPNRAAELVVQSDQTYESPLLPGFQLPLKQLLTLADGWDVQKRKNKGVKKD